MMLLQKDGFTSFKRGIANMRIMRFPCTAIK